MYEFELGGVVPVGDRAIYEALLGFDRCLTAAPAVTSVSREGSGGVDTTYEIQLARFGTTGSVRTTVTATEPARRIDWSADRAIEGSWHFDRLAPERTRVTITIRLEPTLLGHLPLTALLGLGGDRLLRRALLREARPVLARAVTVAGGSTEGMELRVTASGRVDRPTDDDGGDEASREPV
ncbi:MAG: hypothetical protein ACOC42_00970 [Halobacteriota archaeon]